MVIRIYVFMMIFLSPVMIRAQEPLKAAPLPDTGTGWLDFTVKLFPVIWGIISPAITTAIARNAPTVFARVPAPMLSMISVVIGAIGGAMAGSLDDFLLDAGGVSQSVAAVDGAVASYGAHKIATKVTPGEKPE